METNLSPTKEKTLQLSEEESQILQTAMEAEIERLQEKYTIVEASVAESLSVENVTEEEARAIYEERDDLYAFTEIKDGLGLSASQLGINKKYFVARDMSMEDNKFQMYFNPRYFTNGKTRITFKEGCLTYPGIEIPVKRWKNITFHWDGFDNEGNWKHFKRSVGGLNSIIFQHESDHCAGYPGANGRPRTITMMKKAKQ